MSKPYVKIAVTEREFGLVRGSVNCLRTTVEAKIPGTTGDEQRYYKDCAAECVAFMVRLDAILEADTSQDYVPDSEDEDEAAA